MNRRTFLVGAGGTAIVAGSGCTGAAPAVGGANTNSAGESLTMSLSLTAVDNAPDPLSFDVTVSADQLDTTAMPIVEITGTNTGDETVRWSYAGGVSGLPFPQGVRASGTGGVVLGLEDELRAQLVDASTGCARVDQFVRADGIQNTVLEADEQTKRSYALAGVDEELRGNCPDPGEYRMRHDSGEFGTWGFDFTLEQ